MSHEFCPKISNSIIYVPLLQHLMSPEAPRVPGQYGSSMFDTQKVPAALQKVSVSCSAVTLLPVWCCDSLSFRDLIQLVLAILLCVIRLCNDSMLTHIFNTITRLSTFRGLIGCTSFLLRAYDYMRYMLYIASHKSNFLLCVSLSAWNKCFLQRIQMLHCVLCSVIHDYIQVKGKVVPVLN
jgi:hypothetical protein